MQIITLASGLAATFLATAVSAGDVYATNVNQTEGGGGARAKVVNNCSYKVYLWSVLKGDGCPSDSAVELATGGVYSEAFREAGETGVSIKISKSNKCKGVDITQLEYFINKKDPQYAANYLDVSYVDCLNGDCPGRNDGYYLKAGNADLATIADASNPICPTFQCHDAASCDKTSYVLPDDVQTKSCPVDQPLDFYLCGQSAQEPVEETPEPKPSSKEEEKPTPTTLAVKVAAVTPPAVVSSSPPNIKTEVVYVTKYETVNAKRHAHNHAHRHFRA